MVVGFIILGIAFLLMLCSNLIGFYKIKQLKNEADTYNELLIKTSEELEKTKFQKKSSEIRLGFLTEHLAPVLKEFPYDLESPDVWLIPLGNPIDYMVITKDEIAFVEIKTGVSQLNAHQKQIKQLIKDQKIVWKLIRIKG